MIKSHYSARRMRNLDAQVRTLSLMALVAAASVFVLGCGNQVGPTRVAEMGPSAETAASDSSPGSMEKVDASPARGEGSARLAEEMHAPAASETGHATAGAGKDGEFVPDAPAASGKKESADPSADLARMQGGVLTAGSFDDHLRFGDFQDFLAKSMQNDPHETFPRLAYGNRVLVHVHNSQGEPIANARVDIRPANSQSQQAGFSIRTGTDGRAIFLTQKDAPGAYSNEYLVTVRHNQGTPIQKQVKSAAGIWNIEVPDVSMERVQKLDLALVIDATGSMGDEMNYLKFEIDHIAATVKQMFPNVDQRFALIVYRDHGDAFVTRTFDFTSSLGEFRERLASQSATGGGDYPEAMDAALEAASQLSWRRGNAARVMFLIGDAPPHDRNAQRTLTAANKLRQDNVRVFPVAASGSAWKAEFILRTTAFLTMGEFLFLTDHSGVGNPHAKPHVPDYQVEHLNRMMVRMIAQELAGKKLAPAEVIAIERGDTSPLQFQPVQPVVSHNLHHSHAINQVVHCLPATPEPAAIVRIDWEVVRWFTYGLVVCSAILLGAYLNG